ncbi:MAG: pentapeptide repeat-containing protein [Pseudomonadota bacterium]
MGRTASDGETPVNPYSLLDAVNRSSDTAHTAWLIFLAIMAYFMIAVAGVTHKDLLLETAVSLPILGVDIQLTQFFQFAPIVLVLFHLGIVGQLVLLARKTLEFDNAIRLLETSKRRTHPLRLELHNFFFVQAIAGSHRSAVMGGFLHAMSWLTLVVLPVVLILYIQLVFLPYHDVLITWTHRIALVFDIVMLSLLGIFLRRAESSFFSAFWRTTLAYPITFLATTGLLLGVMLFSFLFATIPGERLDRFSRTIFPSPENQADRFDGYNAYAGFIAPFSWVDDQGALFGVFLRNLKVTDTDLVVDRDVSSGEATLNLRGRDLRSAILDRSDLHQADFTGAILNGASFRGADLRDVKFGCTDITEFLLDESRRKEFCTSARGADFSNAKLINATLEGLNAEGANFESAALTGANLAYSILNGALLANANLDKVNLTGGVTAAGADFSISSLRGTDLTGAKLFAADFRSSEMQGAILNYASLQGGVLEGAKLEAASLQRAQLWGANLSRADVTASDLRGVRVWKAVPPEQSDARLSDMGGINFEAPSDEELAALKGAISQLRSRRIGDQVLMSLSDVLGEDATDAGWSGSEDKQRWEAMSALGPGPQRRRFASVGLSGTGGGDGNADGVPEPQLAGYSADLTAYLTKLMCRARWADGSVAAGVALRARGPMFRGDLKQIYESLTNEDCPAGRFLPADELLEMSTAVDNNP